MIAGTANFGLKPVSRVAAPVREQLLMMTRDAILSHVWKPGDRLVERDVCARTGASRSSVREVFRQLETEGLVTPVANKGLIVTVVSAKEASDAYALRKEVETYAVHGFCEHAGEKDIRALGDAFKDLQRATAEGNATEALAANDRFFGVLARGADNVLLEQTLARLRGLILIARCESMLSPGRLLMNLDELRAIFEALVRRDRTAAREAINKHADKACRTAMVAIAEQGGGDEDRPTLQYRPSVDDRPSTVAVLHRKEEDE
jgi:GntR family transcriptional regulator, trigonelline degradation regulator